MWASTTTNENNRTSAGVGGSTLIDGTLSDGTSYCSADWVYDINNLGNGTGMDPKNDGTLVVDTKRIGTTFQNNNNNNNDTNAGSGKPWFGAFVVLCLVVGVVVV
jgi:hypothetical protein